VGFGLSVAPQNRRRKVDAGHTSKSSGLLHVEASLARVSQSGLKTGGGATVDGACGTIVEVASGQVKNGRVNATGCVGPYYPNFAVFNGHNSLLDLCLDFYFRIF
jgi:hypothetical protein